MMFSSISCRPETFLLASPLLQHVGLQFLEVHLACLDLFADALVPRGVALLDEVLQHAVLANLGGDLQALGEGVHAADVGVEQVDRLEALAADLGVEVDAARSQAALCQDHQHAAGRQVEVGRELIGVPAQQQVAAVGVDRAEHAWQDEA